MPRNQRFRVALASIALGVVFSQAHAVDIVINAGSTLAGNAAALASFERAAQKWEAIFSDPITVNINADLANLGPGILGGASPVMLSSSYTTIRDQMVLDSLDEASNAIVSFLPTAAEFGAFGQTGTTIVGMSASKANLKAMGVLGLDAGFGFNDANIAFNTDFMAFYHFGAGAPAAGTIDFETIAAHEIGHALGFMSSVDDADFGDLSLEINPLDLFRFRNVNLPNSNATFTNNPRSFVPGEAHSFGDTTNSWAFSTGLINGDGRQASHWKDDDLNGGTLIGMMDPVLNDGQRFNITNADIRAFDLIGWDLQPVPEPASLVALGLGAAALLRSRKRSKK